MLLHNLHVARRVVNTVSYRCRVHISAVYALVKRWCCPAQTYTVAGVIDLHILRSQRGVESYPCRALRLVALSLTVARNHRIGVQPILWGVVDKRQCLAWCRVVKHIYCIVAALENNIMQLCKRIATCRLGRSHKGDSSLQGSLSSSRYCKVGHSVRYLSRRSIVDGNAVQIDIILVGIAESMESYFVVSRCRGHKGLLLCHRVRALNFKSVNERFIFRNFVSRSAIGYSQPFCSAISATGNKCKKIVLSGLQMYRRSDEPVVGSL